MTDVDAMARECAEKLWHQPGYVIARHDETTINGVTATMAAIIAAALRERDAEWQAKLEVAEAQAAAMRPLVEDYRDDCHVRIKIPIFDAKVMQEHIDACNTALSSTAGRDLLAEVERLRVEVAAMCHDLETS